MRHISIMLSSNLGFIFYFFFLLILKELNPFYAVRGVYLKMPVDELFCKQFETSHGLFATDQLILTYSLLF